MRRLERHIKSLLVAAFAVMLTGCYDTEPYREVCDYKVLLRYDYNEENSTTENRIEYYVYSIDEYIFDQAGVLFAHRRITPDRCREMMNSQWDLPPGRYTVIAIGNLDGRSEVYDAATTRSGGTRSLAAPTPGVTRREDLQMEMKDCGMHQTWNGHHGPSENLYHGYKTFTVKERGISRVRVDMVNAHLKITFRLRWKHTSEAPARGDYQARLESIPSRYTLMPEYVYPAGSFECCKHECDNHDGYPSACNNVIHHIPRTGLCDGTGQPQNLLTYRHDTKINADWEMWGEFTAYRLKDENVPPLRILDGAGQSILPRGKDVDLKAYFEWYEYELDHSLRQEYHIDIEVDGEAIILAPLNVADWDEGGPL